MNTITTQTRVRYSETDQMGVVYHSNYAIYLEIGRTNWLRKNGLSYKEMEDRGIILPVINLNINYKKPATYDDLLIIKTSLQKQSGVQLFFDYEIYNKSNELLTTASTTLVFVNKKTGKPMAPAQYILDVLTSK